MFDVGKGFGDGPKVERRQYQDDDNHTQQLQQAAPFLMGPMFGDEHDDCLLDTTRQTPKIL